MRLLLALALLPLPLAAQETDCANAMTQTDMNICADRDMQEADNALNAAYGTAMDRMRGAGEGGVEALRKAQRSWITFRDQACAAEGWLHEGGSMQPMVVAGCKTRLTQDRTLDLARFATEGN